MAHCQWSISPNNAEGILKNATIAVSSNYLSNSWRSLEMPLISWKAELKLKWTKNCVLSAARNDVTNGNQYYFHYQRHKTITGFPQSF